MFDTLIFPNELHYMYKLVPYLESLINKIVPVLKHHIMQACESIDVKINVIWASPWDVSDIDIVQAPSTSTQDPLIDISPEIQKTVPPVSHLINPSSLIRWQVTHEIQKILWHMFFYTVDIK